MAKSRAVAKLVVGNITVYVYPYGVTIRDQGELRNLVTYMGGRVMTKKLPRLGGKWANELRV